MATDGEVTVTASFSSVDRALRVFRHVAQIPENNHELSVVNYAIWRKKKVNFRRLE